MEFKPGWTYIYSEILKQHIALHNKTGWVYCEDGTKYSPREIAILHKTYGGKEIPLEVHTIKKAFGGEIQENDAAQVVNQQPAKQPPATPVENDNNDFDIF